MYCVFLQYIYLAAPTINNYSNGIVAFEGNKVNLICNATNDPDAIDPVQISWYFRTKPINPDGKYLIVNNKRNNYTNQIHSVLSLTTLMMVNMFAELITVLNLLLKGR